ncbi:aldehyde dehydrogenase [Aurantimicrobium sp. INA4]|uniref:aldehyde dehydrogenase family protein n=1 Tax=Aurantimicrobium sp. INA4 TaxID=2986279 RepID=UPI00249319D6|nr:aldehyde dehydrogenase family protein [Aurantimicrobium sp. INA4]BDU11386.1 aldehyde dehydrogenase [Aurantimicrobium sp. INA4]
MSRLAVPKTYKLFIGGKFPRSESGRVYEVKSVAGDFVANAAQGSRKDIRDAVVAARTALPGWSSATAYNRGQVLYRIAEVLEGRKAQFVEEIMLVEGSSQKEATAQVESAIDTWIWYAGWADKYTQVAGQANPVSGPYFNLSVPEPTGVVAAVAPQSSDSLLGLVATIAPILVSGNTVVVVPREDAPLTAISFAEVMATSDVPGGVVNVISGSPAELAPWMASHADINAFDLAGAGELDWATLQIAAAETLMRTSAPVEGIPGLSLSRINAFTELKTVWHTKSVI